MAGDFQSADTALQPEAVSALPSGASAARPSVSRFSCFLHILPRGYDAVRIVLGLLLLSAAALKTHQLATEPILQTGLFASRWFQIGLVEFEILLGLVLFFGVFRHASWLATVILFAVLAAISLSKGLKGDASCGCFGIVEVSPWYTLGVDLAAIAMLLVWSPTQISGRGKSPAHEARCAASISAAGFATWRISTMAATFFVVGIPAAIAMIIYSPAILAENGLIVGERNVVVLEPAKWIGKRLPLTAHLQSGQRQLSSGRAILVLYQQNCPSCRAQLTQLRALDAQESDFKDCLIAMLDLSGGPQTNANPGLLELTFFDNDILWFTDTPQFLLLESGLVRSVHKDVADLRRTVAYASRPRATAFRAESARFDRDSESDESLLLHVTPR